MLPYRVEDGKTRVLLSPKQWEEAIEDAVDLRHTSASLVTRLREEIDSRLQETGTDPGFPLQLDVDRAIDDLGPRRRRVGRHRRGPLANRVDID